MKVFGRSPTRCSPAGRGHETLFASAPPQTPAQRSEAFLAWANQVRGGLAVCEADSAKVAGALGLAAQSNGAQADMIELATVAKQDAPECSILGSDAIANLDTTTPPSGYPTLRTAASDIQLWADQYEQQVIIDAGHIATSNGSTDSLAWFKSDSQQADQLAEQINQELAGTATQQAECTANWKGLGLFEWNSTGSANTGNTGGSGNTGSTGSSGAGNSGNTA